MDLHRLRGWWFHRQGLDGSLDGRDPAYVLAQTGWSRSVGGANPYLALFARCQAGRSVVDAAVASGDLQELPSARGCTYVLPRDHYAMGLLVGQGLGDSTELNVAIKHLGVTLDEVERLGGLVMSALRSGPKDPRALKTELGDAVRSLGDAGKKRGIGTTLPMTLGRLQGTGRIRRVPVNGRIDNQRYAYALWSPSPLDPAPFDRSRAFKELARLYFGWIGPASMKNFQWFSGLGVKAAQEAVDGLDLWPVPDSDGLFLLPTDRPAWESFVPHDRPCYALVGSIDNLSHLRLGLPDLVDADLSNQVPGETGLVQVGGLSELTSHAIFDRGRLIGVWEFDPEVGRIVWATWEVRTPELEAAVAKTQEFVCEELGDARSFSLDSPESRRPRLDALAGLTSG